MISTILFDLDGTIIDSESLAFRAILDAAGAWGVPITRADASSIAGKKWSVAFDLLFEKYEFPLSKAEASNNIVKRYKELVSQEIRVVPGVCEAIRDFAKHFRLGLVSGSYREDILWALKRLDVLEHFEVVLGAEDYPNSKPAPDGYAKALKILSVPPEEALVFEDSSPGIASAKSAGIAVVAVSSTNHFHQDLSGATTSIHDFMNVDTEWVRRLKL
jgi:HAD superfamily hydrolase (TIGR01509 family)